VIVMGAHPGRIRDVVKVEIERPRELSVKRTPEFLAYTDAIWRQIEDEVRADLGFSVGV
jgi:NitT/TauT family transport system ATP-binding protein